MLLLNVFQDSSAYDAGYSIGYAIGKFLPIIVLILLGVFIYKYFKNKRKN